MEIIGWSIFLVIVFVVTRLFITWANGLGTPRNPKPEFSMPSRVTNNAPDDDIDVTVIRNGKLCYIGHMNERGRMAKYVLVEPEDIKKTFEGDKLYIVRTECIRRIIRRMEKEGFIVCYQDHPLDNYRP